jgi:hypothetical protein
MSLGERNGTASGGKGKGAAHIGRLDELNSNSQPAVELK